MKLAHCLDGGWLAISDKDRIAWRMDETLGGQVQWRMPKAYTQDESEYQHLEESICGLAADEKRSEHM